MNTASKTERGSEKYVPANIVHFSGQPGSNFYSKLIALDFMEGF